MARDFLEHNERSDFERGYRHGNFFNAVVHGLGSQARLRVDFVGAHRLQRAVWCIMPQLMALDKSFYEAALDLGANPFKAFTSVVLPELRPSIFAGFLLAFTMSADDFIITHFTKGAGVDTLTTEIYAELKIGIHPEMYALSTLVFFFVLIFVMLFAINRRKLKKYEEVIS